MSNRLEHHQRLWIESRSISAARNYIAALELELLDAIQDGNDKAQAYLRRATKAEAALAARKPTTKRSIK